MATTPRGKTSSGQKSPRAPSRPKKPATIDLDASDVKDTSVAAKSAATKTASATAKAKPTVAKSSADAKSKPAASPASKPKPAKTSKPVDARTSSKPNPTKPANGNGGFGRIAAAGIIGGVITLGGAGAMQYSGLLPNLGQVSKPTPVVDLDPLQKKLDELQSRLSGIESARNLAKTTAVDLKPLETRIAELENKPVLPPIFGTSDTKNSAAVEKMQSALKNYETSNKSLSRRVSKLESSGPAQPDQTAISAAIDSAIAPLSSAIAPLTSAREQTGARLEQIESNIAALTKKIGEDVDARINAFDKKLKNAATGEKLARSVAINALKSAIENGQPFSAALTSLETLAGPSKPLEKLKPLAASGIATNRQLLDEFHDLQSSLLLAATNDPDAGLSDRLMASLQSLVTVSSDEALPGGSPKAIISRIDANLKSGNFGAAISEWKTLPDPAQLMSKEWIDKLGKRMDGDRQLFKLMKNLQAGS